MWKRWNSMRIFWLFCVFFCLSGIAYGQNRINGDYLNRITTKYTTPHLKWAIPLSEGKLRVLFFTPVQIASREVIELKQRLDMDFEAITCFKSTNISISNANIIEGMTIREKTKEITRKLSKKYDVIVFGNISFDALTDEAKFQILQQVFQGTGLVFFYNRDTKYKGLFLHPTEEAGKITRSISSAGLPEPFWQRTKKISLEKLVKTYQLKKGKIAVVNYPDPSSNYNAQWGGLSITQNERYSPLWKSHYENNMVLAARVIFWASGRTFPDIPKTTSFTDESTFSQDELPNISFLLDKNYQEKLQVAIRIRDERNNVCFLREFPAKNKIEFPLPFLQQGKYFLDWMIKNHKGVMDFGYRSFNVKAPCGSFSLETQKDSYEKGEEITGRIIIEKPLDEKSELFLQLSDLPYKRIWFQKIYSIPAGEKEIGFRFKPKNSLTLSSLLIARLKVDNNIITTSEKYVFFPKRKGKTFVSILWGGLGFDMELLEFMLPQISKAGFNTVLAHPRFKGEDAKLAAIFNLHYMPYMYRILPDGYLSKIDKKDDCFYSPRVQEEAKRVIQARMKNLPRYNPLLYSLGDENCFSYTKGYQPSEEKEFKRYLSGKYASIKNLNREYGTNYLSFEEVTHFPAEEMKKKKTYPLWNDHLEFMEKQYGDYHHYLADVIRKIDPYARVGAEGSKPGNMEYTISQMDFWGPYGTDELLRSIGSSFLRSSWWGGYVSDFYAGSRDIYPYFLWKNLLAGTVNASAWYSCIGDAGFLGADFSYAEYFEKMLPHLKNLYNGTALLLTQNKLQHHGIAIHWSQSSLHASWMEKYFLKPIPGQKALTEFFYEHGFNFDYLTTSMIEKGNLKNYRICFLLGSSSISLKEKKALEHFVNDGGVLVADINPGVLNGYCRRLEKSSLSKIFGAPEIKGEKNLVSIPVNVEEELAGKKNHFKAEKALSSPETGIFKTNKFGKGRSILLNFDLDGASSSSGETSWNKMLLNILALANIKPEVSVESIASSRETMLRIRENADYKLLGILARKDQIGKTVNISMTDTYFVYRVDDRYLGHFSALEERISQPFLLYSLFKKKQGPPRVTPSKQEIAPGDSVRLNIHSPSGKGRVLRIEILNPGGKDMECYRKIVSLQKEKNFVNLAFAYNDLKGNYAIQVTDVVTGLATSVPVRLK